MEPSLLSLIPPVLTIGLALATRRILPALAAGIIVGALLFSQGRPLEAGRAVAEIWTGLIIAEGAIAEEVYILVFVVLLGILSSLIHLSGGLRAFSDWVALKIRSRRQAKLVPVGIGVLIFFDDAFSSLVGGNISRSVTDRFRISRAKLAYLVDSTAAPVIILAPVSAWAAVTAGLMTGIFEDNDIIGWSGYGAFISAIPANYYAISALLLAFAVALLSINIGPMRMHEKRALQTGELYDTSQGPAPGESDQSLPTREDGRVRDLVLPVAVLLGVTLVVAAWLGVESTEGTLSAMAILANTDVMLALVLAGLAACLVSTIGLIRRRTPTYDTVRAAWSGARSMLRAVVVLFLAWTTAAIISLLGVGDYIARWLNGGLAGVLLPVILFALAAFLAFSMGSTFGTFALILPISAQISLAVDPSMVVPTFGAVMAGAIFGDHTSPLSDTTILTSIGAGIHLVDHVKTQLPYALIAAAVSAIGYVLMGLTQSTWIGLAATLLGLAATVAVLSRASPEIHDRAFDIEPAEDRLERWASRTEVGATPAHPDR